MTAVLPQKLQRAVSTAVRSRAEKYLGAGVIRISQLPTVEKPHLKATVRGGEVYSVDLLYNDRTIWAACTCPFFEDHYEVCKHIWATVLRCSLDRIEFPGPVDYLRVDDDADPDDVDLEALDDVLDEPEPEPANVIRWPRSRPAPPPPPRPSRWRAQINAIGSFSANLPTGIRVPPEIIWVLDPELCRSYLSIEIMSRTLKKNGELGKPAPLRLDDSMLSRLPNDLDRHIASMLGSSPYGYTSVESAQAVTWPKAEYLVPKLVETGRLWIRTGDREYQTNVTYDAGEPWKLAVRAEEQNGRYFLVGHLNRGAESIPVREALAITPGGFVIFRRSIARFEDGGAQPWASLIQREDVEIPASELDDFAKSVAVLGSPVKVQLPDLVSWKERRGVPSASIVIQSTNWDYNAHVTPTFDYGGFVVGAFDRRKSLVDEKARTVIVRDLVEEGRKLEVLWAQGFKRTEHGASIGEPRLPDVIPRLIDAGWDVRSSEGVYSGFGQLDMSLRSSIDWFDLDASLTFGVERVRLPRLLSALRKGESVLRLEDGKLGMIRPEWREQLEPFLAAASEEQEEGLRFRRNQVLLLDALLATRKSVVFDEVFEQARRKIFDLEVRPEQPPASFTGVLRPYQSEGLGWFSFLRTLGFGGCLADDMGLGKTIQVLALLDQRRTMPKDESRPSLIVVPRSVIFNWKREAARFTPELRVLDHSTPDRIRATDHFLEYDAVLTTYALVRREVELFADFEFDYVVLDEAQAIKNASSQAAKAASLLRARHRLALSGTPVENHLGELASLFEFLNPGMLRAGSTRMTKILREAGGNSPHAAEARAMLARTVRPFILRRTKAQVATELPDRVEQTVYCDLEPKQRKLYNELRDFYRASLLGRVAEQGLNKSKIHILEALLRMRQAACHPGLVDAKRKGEASAKLDKLFEELPILIDEGHKVLVFSQFTSFLALVRKELEKHDWQYAYIDGKSRDREEQVRRFQEEADCPLFLISLKAGGLGLNLTAAEYVYLLDPWWNPAVEAQAIDRAHRIGQSRKVVAYRLVARDTIEEKILLLQLSKKALADAVISEENSILRQITTEDLDLLLS